MENLLKRFNLFEAVGVVRHELRHSDFLAFLLDPAHNHGLGDIFLREFLQATRLPKFDLATLDLSHASVFREWHHVDILVIDDLNRFAVIVENKIDTAEHSDQLKRYRQEFDSHYPGYTVIGLYLTPEGDAPRSADYHPVSYTLVCEVIEKIAEKQRATLDSEIVMVLEHYVQMLRRHIVSDSDVAILCRRIYRQHKQALDTIFEHIGGQEKKIWEYAQLLIQRTETVYLDSSKKRYMTFGLHEWREAGLFTSPPHIYFEFQEFAAGLTIYLTLSPGDPSYRAKVFEASQRAHFPGCQLGLVPGYCRLAVIPILYDADYEKPQEEIEAIISEKWAVFLRHDLPHITQAIREEEWLLEASSQTSLYQHRPDQQVQIYQYVKSLVQQETDLKIGENGKNGIAFSLHEWQNSPRHGGPSSENICWILYFEFINQPDNLRIDLKITPVKPPGNELERDKHLRMAQKHKLTGCASNITRRTSCISSVPFLTGSDYEKTQKEIEAIISEKWSEYLRDEMPRIVKAVHEEEWLWELP